MENHYNCIYCYTNKVNGKKYVGQAKDFNKRHRGHIKASYNKNRKREYNIPFHNAIRKYGIENFEIEILKDNLQNQDELNYWEKYYITEFDLLAKNGKGYNLALGGEGGNTLAGKTEEEVAEIKRKQSEAWHNKSDEEIKEKTRKWHETMNNKTDEEKAERSKKQSEAWKNRTDEEKAEISRKKSEANKGENNSRARKIVSVDSLTKLPVFIWQYKKQAADFYNISNSTLTKYLKGKAKSGHEYNGFLWYYLDEWEQLTN